MLSISNYLDLRNPLEDVEISFRRIKLEFVLPLFTGFLFSLFICSFIGLSYGYFTKPAEPEVIAEIIEEEEDIFLFSVSEKVPDLVLEYYRNPEFQKWVIDFFTNISLNSEIAEAILLNADRYNVSPALAFALCWEESRFNPHAINRGNRDGSVDRGLFQLNNRSFPNLETSAFYQIEINARNGISHLHHCLNSGGTEISALAMYNAGTGRVRSTGAPHVTLNYVSRILENRQKIESRFHSKLIREEETRMKEQGVISN